MLPGELVERGHDRRPRRPPALSGALERTLHLDVSHPARRRAPLVGLVLPPSKGDLELHVPVLEVQLGRYERQPLLPHLAVQGVDLAAVEEELPIAIGLVVPRGPARIPRSTPR